MGIQDNFNKNLMGLATISMLDKISKSISGKSYQELCLKITDIEIEIAKAKDNNIPHAELDEIYNKLLAQKKQIDEKIAKEKEKEQKTAVFVGISVFIYIIIMLIIVLSLV